RENAHGHAMKSVLTINMRFLQYGNENHH
ncbi:hypothetical protein RX36_04967, partial [Escherichia coli]